jgi:hypothetical protein
MTSSFAAVHGSAVGPSRNPRSRAAAAAYWGSAVGGGHRPAGRDFMFPCKIDEHGNELARRAQLEAMARLSAPAQQRSTHPVAQLLRRLGRHLGFFAALLAAVRSRRGALSVFPASAPGGAGLRRLGSFRCRNDSLAPREQGVASEGRKLPQRPSAAYAARLYPLVARRPVARRRLGCLGPRS